MARAVVAYNELSCSTTCVSVDVQDLSKDPRMFVDGFTRFDVVQGELGMHHDVLV